MWDILLHNSECGGTIALQCRLRILASPGSIQLGDRVQRVIYTICQVAVSRRVSRKRREKKVFVPWAVLQ